MLSKLKTRLKRKKEKILVGIIVRDRQIVYTKSVITEQGKKLSSSIFFPVQKDLGFFKNLEQSLSNLPKSFFKDAAISFCVPMTQITIQKAMLPRLSEEETGMAIKNLVDEDHDVWQYIAFSEVEKQERIFSDICIFKLRATGAESYIDIFDRQKLTLTSMTCEPAIISNFYDSPFVRTINFPFLMADLGRKYLKLYIIENKKVIYFRCLPFGHSDIVNTLVRKIKIEDEEVFVDEDAAREILSTQDLFNESARQSKDHLEHMFFLLRPSLEKLTIEMKKSINFFSKQNNDVSVHNVYLTGDFLKVRNIGSYLEKEMEIPIHLLTYTDNISGHNKKNKPGIEESLCMSMATTDNKFVNFLPEDYKKRQLTTLTKKVVVALAGSVALIIAIIAFQITRDIDRIVNEKHFLVQKHRSLENQKIKLNIKNTDMAKETEQLNFVNQVIDKRFPLEDFLYSLSLLSGPDFYLDEVSFIKDSVTIRGKLTSNRGNAGVMTFVQKVSKINYLSDVTFDILTDSENVSGFKVNARYKKGNK